jgi:hypothetical protein
MLTIRRIVIALATAAGLITASAEAANAALSTNHCRPAG